MFRNEDKRYDFEMLLSRENTGSFKWDGMLDANPDVPSGIVPFSVADMEFKNAPEIAEGLYEYLQNSILGYTLPTDGFLDAITAWMKRRHGWDVKKEWLVDYPGVVPSLYHLVKLLTEEDEGVIIFTPVYYPFYNAIDKGKRRMVQSPLVRNDNRYEIDYADFERKAKEARNKLCILCNPHNPVGRVWTEEELEKVGRICIDNGVTVISDEIHADLIMPGHKHTVFGSISEEFANNSIICTAPSKTFNIAGMLTSSLIIPNAELKERVYNYREDNAIYFCNQLGYKTCEIVYNQCEQWLEELLEVLDTNRKFIKEFMREKFPEVTVFDLEGTYLQWLDFNGLGLTYQELEKFMVEEAFMFTDEGHIFGKLGEGYERINLACPTWVLKEGLERMYEAWWNR